MDEVSHSPSQSRPLAATPKLRTLRPRGSGLIEVIDCFRESLMAIRLRPDGLVDPATVDGRIRAMTLAIRALPRPSGCGKGRMPLRPS